MTETGNGLSKSMREQANVFAVTTGLQVLYGLVQAKDSTERLEIVFLRADDALTLAKDSAAEMGKAP